MSAFWVARALSRALSTSQLASSGERTWVVAYPILPPASSRRLTAKSWSLEKVSTSPSWAATSMVLLRTL